jgi:hypothetical protein
MGVLRVAVAILALQACGDSSSDANGVASDAGDASAMPDGTTQSDGSAGDASGDAQPPDDWPPTPDLSEFSSAASLMGRLEISHSNDHWNHDYSFRITEPVEPSKTCSENTVGECRIVFDCNPTGAPTAKFAPLYPTQVSYSGGTGADIVVTNVEKTTDESRWKPGDSVKATVTGNPPVGIPDFSADLVFPGDGVVDSSLPKTNNHYQLVRGSPFPLTWPAGPGTMQVRLQQGSLGTEIVCEFSASTGAASIPGELTGQLAIDDVGQFGLSMTSLTWQWTDTVAFSSGKLSGEFRVEGRDGSDNVEVLDGGISDASTD